MEPLEDAVDHGRGWLAGLTLACWGVSAGTWRAESRPGRDGARQPLFIDGMVYRGAYNAAALLEAFAR
jgi:hypothetical protein